jgi:hypothetical protein
VLLIFFFAVKPATICAQEKADNYFISLKIGPPVANSKTSFETFWYPVVDVSLSALKHSYANFYTGLEFDYSGFFVGEWNMLNSKLHIINPNVTVGYDILLLKRLKLFPDFSIGYSWMRFTNSITPSKYMQTYNESGFSISPGLSISYIFKNRMSLGLNSSYKIIFEEFGRESIHLFESAEEADYTSYFNLSLCVGFSF